VAATVSLLGGTMHTKLASMRKALMLVFFVCLTGTSAESGQGSDEAQDGLPSYFPYPATLQPQVEFWKKIFTTYSKYHAVIHDSENMKIYKVLDFRSLVDEEGLDEATVNEIKKEQTKIEVEQVRAILLKLHQCSNSCQNLSVEEQKIWNLYRQVSDQDKFRAAASEDRLRAQTGVRERFSEGIQASGRYMKAMEEIFRREGVPIELTRLPFIESCFNIEAYSKAGAAGIWQFIPSTGRLYKMRVGSVVDERRDPLLATKAAAQLLRDNYEDLGTWPLAITAYNHGPAGVARAVDTLGTTDIEKIIRSYRGKNFGFASRNFYPEFLAALQVQKNVQKHFGQLQAHKPVAYEEVHVELAVPLKTAARFSDTDAEQLLFLNPALGRAVRSGYAAIPRGYRLRVPVGTSAAFLGRYKPWQIEERTRLVALEQKRKARLAALRARKRARGKYLIAKSGKRKQGAPVIRVSDGKSRGRRG
jgi:membrane-bound lytic murein transglycosylase D